MRGIEGLLYSKKAISIARGKNMAGVQGRAILADTFSLFFVVL
jgi:hypothetical protein